MLNCPEVVSVLKHSTDFLGEKSFRAYGDALRSCADRLQEDGVDLAGYWSLSGSTISRLRVSPSATTASTS